MLLWVWLCVCVCVKDKSGLTHDAGNLIDKECIWGEWIYVKNDGRGSEFASLWFTRFWHILAVIV